MIVEDILEKVMIAINKIAQVEGFSDFSKAKQNSMAIWTSIHYQMNNSPVWD